MQAPNSSLGHWDRQPGLSEAYGGIRFNRG